MSLCDEDKEIKDSSNKCLTLEDISAAGVSSTTDASKLKDLLLLRKEFLPVLHDSADFGEDNASLEANYGDESSCCVSEVSSLSFQNAVLDDPDYSSGLLTQARGEGGSGDNDLQDASELSENPSELPENVDEMASISDNLPDAGLDEAGGDLAGEYKDIKELTRCSEHEHPSASCDVGTDVGSCDDKSNKVAYYTQRSKEDCNGNHSSSKEITESLEVIGGKEISGGIRVKDPDAVSAARNQQQLKSSPGLARRMMAGEDMGSSKVGRHLSSHSGRRSRSPKDDDFPTKSHDQSKSETKDRETGEMDKEKELVVEDKHQEVEKSDIENEQKPSKDLERQSNSQEKRDRIAHMDALYKKQIEALMQNQSDDGICSVEMQKASLDIENEYNYVKYTRVQDKQMYFGMQVVQKNDELGLVRAEKEKESSVMSDSVSDGDDGKTLNVNVTEKDGKREEPCDFAKMSLDAAESELGEGVIVVDEKLLPCHMPSVEDGLSSGHASDCEETLPPHCDPCPADILKSRQRSDIQQRPDSLATLQHPEKIKDDDLVASDPFSKTRQQDVEQAIQDIRSAIERSKKVKLVSPTATNEEQLKQPNEKSQEPVWITRKEQAKDLQQHSSKSHKETSPTELEKDQKGSKVYTLAKEYSTDEETDELLNKQYTQIEKVDIPELSSSPLSRSQTERRQNRAREVALRDPTNETVLIEGVLFRANYLGSTQLISEGQPSKGMRMMQAQEAVGRIKAPEGETQPSTEVDLFVSVEKIMVLNTDLQEIMMDHALRTISYIADIGDILVIMARRGPVMSSSSDGSVRRRNQTKICCHVFESDEAQLIAQSIGQAFQVSYMEFLKANGIDNPSHICELDYQEVLNQQEIFGEELYLFSNREMQKEIIVPKVKGEPLGIVIVESGWGSMVPTVVLANMSPTGSAARCGQLNIGDQIMSINGISLVGLPLSTCQNYIKVARHQSVVKLVVVSCPPVVEVLIKRPDIKYQLGFSVQNGVICSLLRGGIAERGGIRVGHRIIEINGQSVVAISHDKIVHMLATSVGEIQMKTMPTSIFRLLTGQDVPHYI